VEQQGRQEQAGRGARAGEQAAGAGKGAGWGAGRQYLGQGAVDSLLLSDETPSTRMSTASRIGEILMTCLSMRMFERLDVPCSRMSGSPL
jgi:hypothetical protein